VLDTDGAGVSIANAENQLEFITATDRTLTDLEVTQQQHQAGPCVEAFRRGEPIVLTNIAEQARWDAYRDAAAASNYAAVIGAPLKVGGHRIGSLNIYNRQPRDWTADDVDAATAFAEIATAYTVRAGQLAEAVDVAGQLQHALDSRIIIEQAKGVLSHAHSISVGAAFELLRSYSRSHNQPIRDIAHAVVHDHLDIT
jgi:GAF domain-containing protein